MSELWVEIMSWVAAHEPGRLDQLEGLWRGETPDWEVAVNGKPDDIEELPPLAIRLASKQYIAIGIVHPTGGMIGGASEDDLIAHFKDATASFAARSEPSS